SLCAGAAASARAPPSAPGGHIMLTRFASRFRPSPAMVVACLALFVALSGTALAVNAITSNSQVSADTISGHNPPAGKHANVIGGSLNATDLAGGAVTLAKL